MTLVESEPLPHLTQDGWKTPRAGPQDRRARCGFEAAPVGLGSTSRYTPGRSTLDTLSFCASEWRGWDSNPRYGYSYNGFFETAVSQRVFFLGLNHCREELAQLQIKMVASP